MRTCYGGTGADTTSAVQAYLSGSNELLLPKLFIIGNPEDPFAIFLTDYGSPLSYALYPEQIFKAGAIRRGAVKAKVGLDSDSVNLTWNPPAITPSQSVATASPLLLARMGYYDKWKVRMMTGFMPTPGDINTLGTCTDFFGRIMEVDLDRTGIKFSVESPMAILSQQDVPTNVIRNSATQIAYIGATPPAGETNGVPLFTAFTGSTDNVIYGDVLSPYSAGHIFGTNAFNRGYLVFLDGPGATLPGFFSPVALSGDYIDGTSAHHNSFTLYSQMPWPPTPWNGSSGDRFYVSATPPVDLADGATDVFPKVPSPENAA